MPRPKNVLRALTGRLVNSAYQLRAFGATLTKRYYQPPTDGYGIYEDISPDIGVGVYGPRLVQIANAGFKLVLNYSLLNTNTAGMVGYINYAASVGLKVIVAIHTDQFWLWGHINQYPQLYADAGNPATLQAMAAYIVNQCKSLPGTWGWYIADEPSPSDSAALLAWAGYIRTADTTGKPRLIVTAWDDHTKNFSGLPGPPATSPWDSTYCEVGGDDFYPLGDTRNVWASTASQAAAIQATCTARGIGSCMVLQSFSQTRYPSLQPRSSPYPTSAAYPSTLQMQQQKDAVLRNMTPRLVLWYSYQDTIVDWTDVFTVDTSGYRPNTGEIIYNQAHNNGGSNATWVWDTANSRLVQSGGTEGVLEVNGITALNGYVEAVMDEADGGAGLCARRVDSTHVYTLYLKDNSNGNTFDLEVINGGYTSLASGSLPVTWTRGTQHTFRLTTNGTTISATMDGTNLASVTDTGVTGMGKFGLIGGANARFYGVTVIPTGAESSSAHLANLSPVIQSDLSHSIFDNAVYAINPLRYYKSEDSTGFFAADSGSAHSDATYHNDGLGASGSLVGVTQGRATLTPADGALSAGYDGSSGLVELSTTGLPTGAQPWTLYAVVSMPTVQSGYKAIVWMGGTALYYTTQYQAGGELIASVQGVTDLRATSPAFTAGATYHVGATYDGSILRLYINGSLAAQQTIGAISIGYGFARIAADSGGDYNQATISKAIIDSVAWPATNFATLYTLSGGTSLGSGTLAGMGTLASTFSLATALTDSLPGAGMLAGTVGLSTALSSTLSGVGACVGGLTASGTTTLSLYGSNVAATDIATSGKCATTIGGVETAAVTTAPPSGSGYVECFALGGTSTVNASLLAPSGKGWLLDSTLLEGNRLLAGNWTASVAVSDANGGGPVNSYTLRFWQRSSGGTFAAIGSLVLSASQVISTVRVVKAFLAAAMPQTDFAVGDKLYIDFFINANGWASDVLSVYVSNSGAAGVAGDLEVDTAGFIPSGTAGVVTSYVPRALSALLIVTSTALLDTLSGSGTLSGAISTLSAALAITFSGGGVLSGQVTANLALTGTTLVGASSLSGLPSLATSLATSQFTGSSTLSASVLARTILTSQLAGIGTLASSFQLATNLAGTLAGTGQFAGLLTANLTLAGIVLPAVGAFSGIVGLTTVLGTTMASGGQLSATMALTSNLSTTFSGAGQLSALVTASLALPGVTLAGRGTLAGVLSTATPVALSTTIAGGGTLNGIPALATQLTGTLAGIGALSSTMTASLTLASTTLAGNGALIGATARGTALSTTTLVGVSALGASLSAALTLSGTSLVGVGAFSGTLTGAGGLVGTLSGGGTLAGSLSATLTLIGTSLAGIDVLSATVQASTVLSVTLAGTSTLSGVSGARTALGATLAGTGTLTGTTALATALTGTVSSVGTLAGAAGRGTALSVTLPGSGQLIAVPGAQTALTSSFAGIGGAAFILFLRTSFTVTLSGAGNITTASMSYRAALALTLAGVASLSGSLTVPVLAYLTATWKTRDGQVVWVTRDEQEATWKTRDGQVVWKIRS